MGKKLTTWQAACIITGYGVGSGIMTLPYLITRAGTVSALAILLLAFFFSYCMHMMLAELTMGVGKGTQIVGIFQHYLFRGRFGKALTMGMFVLVTLVLVFNLAAYVAGGAEILASAGLPPLAAKIVFYAIAAAVVFFGLKVLGISEAIDQYHYRHHRHSGRRKHVPPGQRHLLRCRKLLRALGVFRHGHDVFHRVLQHSASSRRP